MADDQQNKPSTPSTIDDLVKELSNHKGPSLDQPLPPKTTVSQGPPPNLPGVKIENKPPMLPAGSFGPVGIQKPPLSSSMPSVVPPKPPTPPLPMPPKPAAPPVQPQPVAPPISAAKPSPVQEYKSSIRTMGEDITSLKSGQKPLGIDVPRKVAPEMPKAPVPGMPKQEVPGPTGPRPAVGLGRAEKTGSLPTVPVPGAKKPTELPKPPTIQPSITVPSEKKGLGMSRTSWMLIGGILIVGGFLYWFLALKAPSPEVVVSPTPTPTITPTPVVKNLGDIFEGIPVNFEIISGNNIGGDFKTFVGTLNAIGKEFLKTNLMGDVNGSLVSKIFLDMFDSDLVLYPTALKDNVIDSIVAVYGQSESFSQDGSVSIGLPGLKKTVFVARVRNKAAVETLMNDWESTIADDLADYLLIADTSKEGSVNFLDNAYRTVLIRYKNFPFPDMTVDYAVVEAAGQSYLVISGSREAMYAAIDILLAQ